MLAINIANEAGNYKQNNVTLGGKRDFTKQKNIGILKLQEGSLHKKEKDGSKPKVMDMIKLMGKRIDPDNMEILYDVPFTEETVARDFEIRDGNWYVEDGWLIGENRKNSAAMAISKESFYGPVCLDFYAKILEPCTHDINCMWSGSWDEETNTRALAYVAGIGGWWDGKIGFEKSPQYKLCGGTKLFQFDPGHTYHMQCGSIGGHIFIIVDGQLAVEMMDPDPIDQSKFGRIGFEAFCTRAAYRDVKVRRASYIGVKENYDPEF